MPSNTERLPSTLERSAGKIQRTYLETLDSALKEYKDEAQAHRTAWAAVKHVAEKRDDQWVLKEKKRASGTTSNRPT
jgi:cation transport regulator ChaB